MGIEGAAGFWSYVRRDDHAVGQRITRLASLLTDAFGLITGEELELFVDRESIQWGDSWRERIEVAIAGTTFFIPILTPRYFESTECRQELLGFLSEARRGGVEQLLLPVYYVTVPELEDDPTDELMIAVKERQWEDLRDVRLVDENASDHRAAVDRLAQRIAEIAQAVSQVPDSGVSPTTGNHTDEPNAGGSDESDEGLIEKLAKGEEALGEIAGTLEAMALENQRIGELAVKATGKIRESDRHQRGFAGRMAVAQRYAERLREPATSIQALGEQYTRELMAVHGMTTAILEVVENNLGEAKEAEDFLLSVVTLSEGAAQAAPSTRSFLTSLQENVRLSRSLRAPTRDITAGLQAFIDGAAIIEGWASRARAVLAHLRTEGDDGT